MDDRPTPAEQARTALACARVAWLTTYPRSAPARPHGTSVAVVGEEDGRPVVSVAAGSLAAAHLSARPLATVRVAPGGAEAVTLHGSAERLPRSAEPGRLHFRVDVGAVRLGAACPVPVPSGEYLAARPDPLRAQAPAVLRHLAERHADALAACLRACGHDAEWAEPRGLDRRGLDVLAVGSDGVELVRLAFPAPVGRLADLQAGLALPLLCRCGE